MNQLSPPGEKAGWTERVVRRSDTTPAELPRKVEIVSQARLLDDVFKVDEACLRFEKFGGEVSETIRRLNFERGDAVAGAGVA